MTKFLNISTDNTLGGSSPSDEVVSSQKAIKQFIADNTAPAGSYVTTNTAQTITEAKTFTKAVHFTGTGDNNAVFITENTRFDIEGTTRTILGMGNGQFYINHSAYALLLRGKNARPSYNSATSYLALLSDLDGYVPNTRTVNGKALSSDISLTASDVGALPDSTVIPTDTSDLTNGAGFITGITSSDVTNALGYTPYNSNNPAGYQENVIETVKVNGTSLTPSNKAVDITVPTVNNPTITITQGGVTKGSFTLNQSTGDTIALDAGGASAVTSVNGRTGAVTGLEETSNKVTSVSSSSTDTQYPTAKCLYDIIQDFQWMG